MTTVRICVCGDASVGKSSLIACLVKDAFVPGKIQAVLPQITIPPIFGTIENVTTVIVDTSNLPEHRETLNREIKKSNVILLVYSDHYSYERLGLFWLPHFRSLGVNVPVILCASKSDAPDTAGDENPVQAFEEETLPLMNEFKEVDSCLRASAKDKHNVREAFFLCQKAVTHPVAPLYDSKEQLLKPAAVKALRRIFWLADQDKDGFLSDSELQAFQSRCFGKPLEAADLQSIKQIIAAQSPHSVCDAGIDEAGFLFLNKYFVDKGRHETVWIIVRAFHYTDSLSLRESFLRPKFDVPAFSSAELSPAGYQFFFDLFLRFDQDKDGGLNDVELAALFAPTPGLPYSWVEETSTFPSSTVRDEAGHITLQGWLAQWSMTTFASPKTTLEYLAYLGFEPSDSRNTNVAALKVTKPRKQRKKLARVERNVIHAYIVGAPGAGKSALLDAFLARPFIGTYHPTLASRVAVNSVELPGGKQCYLIIEELGPIESAVLDNQSRLEACDLLIYAYDSGDLDSFAYLTELRSRNTRLEEFPSMFVALKADADRAVQRGELQPEDYCVNQGLQKPHHVSVTWKSIQELFVHIAELALRPNDALPRKHGDSDSASQDRLGMYLGLGAVVAVGAAGIAIWKKSRND